MRGKCNKFRLQYPIHCWSNAGCMQCLFQPNMDFMFVSCAIVDTFRSRSGPRIGYNEPRRSWADTHPSSTSFINLATDTSVLGSLSKSTVGFMWTSQCVQQSMCNWTVTAFSLVTIFAYYFLSRQHGTSCLTNCHEPTCFLLTYLAFKLAHLMMQYCGWVPPKCIFMKNNVITKRMWQNMQWW